MSKQGLTEGDQVWVPYEGLIPGETDRGWVPVLLPGTVMYIAYGLASIWLHGGGQVLEDINNVLEWVKEAEHVTMD